MMNDPIVNEIRKYRDEHSKKFDYNLDAIVADYQVKHQDYVSMLAKINKKNANKVAPCNQFFAPLQADT